MPFDSAPLTQNALGDGKELWAIRVPSSIPAKKLNGLVIKLPTKATTEPLGSLEATLGSQPSKFNVYLSQAEGAKQGAEEDAQQLIQMAASGARNPLNPTGPSKTASGNASIALGQGGAAELSGIRVLVPEADGKQAGRMKLASVGIKRHFHLSLASPAEAGIGATAIAAAQVKKTAGKELGSAATEVRSDTGVFESGKAKREQPWDRLSGKFKPAGTTSSASPQPVAAAADKDKKRKKDVEASPEKKDKKKKKKA